MANDNGGSSVGIIAIVAVLVLAGIAAWLFAGRTPTTATDTTNVTVPAPQQQAPAPAADDNDVNLKVDLPDTIKIDP
jgi:hypothetical protein